MKNSEIIEQVESWWYVTWSMSGALGIRPVSELHALNAMNVQRGAHPVGCTVLGIFPTSEAAQEYRSQMTKTLKEERLRNLRNEEPVGLPCGIHGVN